MLEGAVREKAGALSMLSLAVAAAGTTMMGRPPLTPASLTAAFAGAREEGAPGSGLLLFAAADADAEAEAEAAIARCLASAAAAAAASASAALAARASAPP